MKRIIILLLAVICILLALALSGNSSAASSDKIDTECSGQEVEGRCADKCPEPSYLIGYDKETGEAICKTVTGCPYGDSIPLGPECDKSAPATDISTPVSFDNSLPPIDGK